MNKLVPAVTSIDVHNAGHVQYVDHMGDDLRVANVARVSFNNWKASFDSKDAKLIRYLLEHEHTSPFRHASLSFRVKAPVFVLRQWGKHQVGCAWNEVSMRYVTVPEPEFWVPDQWRRQAKNKKQGSSDVPFSAEENDNFAVNYKLATGSCIVVYNHLLENGVAGEQARTVLPQSMYTSVIWTASLQAVLHFLHLRLDAHAQKEIQDYARAVEQITRELFPATFAVVEEMQNAH